MARSLGKAGYGPLAECYDRLYGSSRGPIDMARERVLRRILPHVESACDLACGTGTTALSLARRGVRTFAVDLSPVMCRAARDKSRRAGIPFRVIRADMRAFRLPEPVDLITCEYDALSHVPAKTDLRRVARAVRRALKAGGYFFFDVNNRRGFETYWTGAFCVEQPGVVAIMRSGNDAVHDRAWSDIDIFLREGRLWRRRRDRVDEVCWSDGEIRQVLAGAGFEEVHAWDASPFFKETPVVAPGCRSIYLARRRS